MFPVEIRVLEGNEKAMTARMDTMREWLDHRRCEPSTFRYTFEPRGLVFRVHFEAEAEAVAFAKDFGGRVMLSAARWSDASAPGGR